MIKHGEIGDILHVVTEYPQDWLISAVNSDSSDQAMWRLIPRSRGESLCTADIGTHLEQLIVQMTGLEIKRVLARFDTYPRDLPLGDEYHDHAGFRRSDHPEHSGPPR